MRGSKKVYREIPHTADVAIEVEGKNLADLFERAGIALSQLIFGEDMSISPRERVDFKVSGMDLEDLFVRFLSELHYIALGRLFCYCSVTLTEGPDPSSFWVSGYVMGEPFDPEKHVIELEIKAVTYHMVSVEKRDGVWVGRVVFDV